MHPFTSVILEWGIQVDRPMPWRNEKDPYKIWLSEVILQQTRVDQGWNYYTKFVTKYPTVQALSSATEQEVLMMWQGLGYYSRARNLHKAAKEVVRSGGSFPTTYKGLLALPGVGPYTAAAIASFAYDLPNAVIDGNVYRVLSRYFNIDAPINKPKGQKVFKSLAEELLPHQQAAAYNQAIMDFGATLCTPKKPGCITCPLANSCLSYNKQLVTERPVKEGKLKRRKRYFHYIVIFDEDTYILKKREAKDIWQGLFDFPMYESNEPTGFHDKVIQYAENIACQMKLQSKTDQFKHILTHQDLFITFWEFKLEGEIKTEILQYNNWLNVCRQDLDRYGLPKPIEQYFTNRHQC